MEFKMFDVVRLTLDVKDLEGHDIPKDSEGTIVEIHSNDFYEIEFNKLSVKRNQLVLCTCNKNILEKVCNLP